MSKQLFEKHTFLTKKIFTLRFLLPYRFMAYFATALTGFSALCAQVIWQKHLAILTGSEARSLSLVIAVFLSGLAGGYYIFGRLTEKTKLNRFFLIKFYGYAELLTGLYIGLFPLYFEFLKNLSFHSPDWLIIDILISYLALLLPTVLMGAGIPMLTATLPENSKEVNRVHAKVYGWNAFGACFGALVSGFYLIPTIGLNLSLHLIGLLNVLASLVFIGNSLKGSIKKQEEPPAIPSPLPNSFFMLFVFLTGALLISFEVIFVRILNLSIGAGVYNFPIILSIFVGGLALGSLSIKKQKISIGFFVRQLFIIILFLQMLFYTAPYWSIWTNHIRISLTSIPSNYFIYYLLIFLFLLLFLFPTVFFMGRLLPLTYMFLKKTKDNYGKVCGKLYFFNTLGTVFGAVVIGYLAFYFFNLDILFKINIYILFFLTLAMILYRKNKLDFIILSALGVVLLFLPTQWDRSGHEAGYFRTNKYNPKDHFKSLFYLPKSTSEINEVTFFKDGPNTTVSLIHYFNKPEAEKNLLKLKQLLSASFEKYSSYSIFVNGKSDGNSIGDFSTMFFMLPYLYSAQKDHLEVAFIGLGTGLSAGAYTLLEDVKSIEVLEISPFVIRAIESTPPELNFHVMKNKKVKIIETDAFKYWTKNKKKFDIIVSEPSNPWVVGVENLFTLEFYQLVQKSLNKGGIFGQWLQTYSIDFKTLKIVIKTINQVFPQAQLYQVGNRDILIVASSKELESLSKKKFNHPFIKKFYKAMGVKKVEDLYLSQIFNSDKFHQLAQLSQTRINGLIYPQLIYRTDKSRFLGTGADPYNLVNSFHADTKKKTQKIKAFESNVLEKDWQKRCLPSSGFDFLCNLMSAYIKNWRFLKDSKSSYLEKFSAYLFLRKRGLISYNKKIMDDFFKDSLEQKNKNLGILSLYIYEKAKNKDYAEAYREALAFKNNKLINEQNYSDLKSDLDNVSKAHKKWDNSLKNDSDPADLLDLLLH